MISGYFVSGRHHSIDERNEQRRRCHFDPSKPHVLIDTCCRFEVYSGTGSIPEEVARHLYRVAAGLESELLGENAILGQVRKSYLEAAARFRLGSSLNRLFQGAIHTGKRVRSETGISSGAMSCGELTVELMKRSGFSFRESTVAVIGVNALTSSILRFLRDEGAERFYLSNRHFDKADEAPREFGGTAVDFARRKDILPKADACIVAARAPHYLVGPGDFPAGGKRILIFDISVPRNVDPAVSSVSGVRLLDLEDIERAAAENERSREEAAVKAEDIIEDELGKLWKWERHSPQAA